MAATPSVEFSPPLWNVFEFEAAEGNFLSETMREGLQVCSFGCYTDAAAEIGTELVSSELSVGPASSSAPAAASLALPTLVQ